MGILELMYVEEGRQRFLPVVSGCPAMQLKKMLGVCHVMGRAGWLVGFGRLLDGENKKAPSLIVEYSITFFNNVKIVLCNFNTFLNELFRSNTVK